MADDAAIQQLQADLRAATDRIAEMERRMEFHDGQRRTDAATVERVMDQAKQIGAAANDVATMQKDLVAAQREVTNAKGAFDRLDARVDAMETKVEKLDGPEPAKAAT